MVTGATLRAQHVLPGDLFAALPGARVHGADFADAAIRAGAVAVLTDEAGAARPAIRDSDVPVLVHDDPRRRARRGRRVDLRRAVAAPGRPRRHRHVRQDDHHVHDRRGAARRRAAHRPGRHRRDPDRAASGSASAFTTPEAPDLQALFAVMVERGVTHVPMEVSSHALALGRVERHPVRGRRVHQPVAATTWTSTRTWRTTSRRRRCCSTAGPRTEVVCVDGEWGKRLVTPHTITVATDGEADWTATGIADLADGRAVVHHARPGGPGPARSRCRCPGSFNVANALLAAACLHARRGVARRTSPTGLADGGGAGPDGAGRARPGLHRGRRLRAQAGGGRAGARRDARPHRRPA